MKRSEALKMLQPCTIGITEVIKRENFESGVYLMRAERLLDFIENKLGMKPPTITILPNSYDRENGTYGFEVNEWEPEDMDYYPSALKRITKGSSDEKDQD